MLENGPVGRFFVPAEWYLLDGVRSAIRKFSANPCRKIVLG
jgi:hypothetical protein